MGARQLDPIRSDLDVSPRGLALAHPPTQVVFPEGVPDDVHEEPINIDLTPVRKGEKGDGRVLVSEES